MITVEQVVAAVSEIESLAGLDDERARDAEGSLYVEVLETVASGRMSGPDAARLAREAYRTGTIEFSR